METAQDMACFQTGIDRLQEWADKWQMAFNVDKCHILHMGEKNKKFKYQLGGVTWKQREGEEGKWVKSRTRRRKKNKIKKKVGGACKHAWTN